FYERLLGTRPEAEWPEGAIFAAGGVEVLVHEPSRASAREVAPHTRGTCRPSRRASADVELVSF
ncbi:MAG TPA: hypothetical protein VK926_00440, partial [Gaiellaceae bacterium]|nr:hypothetical protein [Gaiellaceae bacterium]